MPRKLEKYHKKHTLRGGYNRTMEEDDSGGFSGQDHPSSQQVPQEVVVLQQPQQSSPADEDEGHEEDEDEDEYEDQEDEDFCLEGQLCSSPGESTPSHSDSSTKIIIKSKSQKSPPTSNSKGKANKANRCQICRKKVGLTGFTCRCGGLYCALHRYSDKHDCDFDYRKLGAEEIRKNNPVIEGEKIHKI